MPKVTFRLKLQMKDSVRELIPGWGAGVVCMQDVVFDFPKNWKEKPLCLAAISDAQDDFMRRSAVVQYEQIPNDQADNYPPGGVQ